MKRNLNVTFDHFEYQRPNKKTKFNEKLDNDPNTHHEITEILTVKMPFLTTKKIFNKIEVFEIIKITQEIMEEKHEKLLIDQKNELYENFSRYCEDYLGNHKNDQKEFSYIS